MSESHSTPSPKPEKPRPDFPLFPHAAGVWAKKIRGQLHYFGPWEDPEGALARYEEQAADLHAGRTPRPAANPDGPTVKEAANAYLNAKQRAVAARRLSPRTYRDYKTVADLLVKTFGKARLVADLRTDDFARLLERMGKTWGPLRVACGVTIARGIFKHAYDADL